jgi:hypothetical protein
MPGIRVPGVHLQACSPITALDYGTSDSLSAFESKECSKSTANERIHAAIAGATGLMGKCLPMRGNYRCFEFGVELDEKASRDLK